MKRVAISIGLAFALAGGISGCSMMKPSAKSGQNSVYFEYKDDKPSSDLVQLNLPIKENAEINKKLKLVNKAFKLSIILTDLVYQNAELDGLIQKNEEVIAALEEKIKGKPQEEQEKELTAMKIKLEATPEFKKAKAIVDEKGNKILAEILKLGVDELKSYIVSKLDPSTLKSNSSFSNMSYLDKAATLKDVALAVNQIVYTIKGLNLVTQRTITNTAYAGEDLAMYFKNSLTKSLTEDLSESKALDS